MEMHANKTENNESLLFQWVAVVSTAIWAASAFIRLQILNNLSEYDLFGRPLS